MDNFKGKKPESPEDILQKIPVLSSYAKGLETHIKERYLKISVVGVDPVALPSEQLSPECLPPIEVSNLLSYLVLETSHYTNKPFKAFKSLRGCNQMSSGFVASVNGKETCSHVASALFYIEATTRIQGKLTCTQEKCT